MSSSSTVVREGFSYDPVCYKQLAKLYNGLMKIDMYYNCIEILLHKEERRVMWLYGGNCVPSL